MDNNEQFIKEREKEEKKTRRVFLSILAITVLVLAVLGLSFATFQQDHKAEGSNSIVTQNISMNYTEGLNGISIVNAIPISDAVGKKLNGQGEYFDFTIDTTIAKNTKVKYEIAAVKEADSTILDENIKLYLEQQVNGTYEEVMAPVVFTPIKSESAVGSPSGSMILKTVEKSESSSDNYRLRMWIKEDASIAAAQKYTVKVNVYGKAQ